MRFADKFCIAMRSDLFRAATEVEDCAAVTLTPCGFPPPYVLSPEQGKLIAHAVADIRKVAHALDLRENSAALAGRERQGSTRGMPASRAARALLY